MSELLTIQDIALILCCTEKTARKWMRSVPQVILGNRILIKKEDFERFLQLRTIEAINE